jgi:hypothetical protein
MGCIALFVLTTVTRDAEAIPAFARKYKTACITCHATFPRLTALGEAFRLNGYRMPGGDELYVKDTPMVLGAEAYKQVFPNAVWPSDIPGMPPLALRVAMNYTANTGGGVTPKTNFNIDEVALLGAGSLGENMAFFVVIEHHDTAFGLNVQKTTLETGETVVTDVNGSLEPGTEFSAWLMWSNLFKNTVGANHFNLRFGTVGKQDLALPNSRIEGAISVQNYLYAEELEIDAAGSASVGAELNGFGKHWRYNFGVMNGDNESNKKNYYAAASFKIGGLGYDGSGGTTVEGGLKTTPSGYWRDDSVRFGGFYYTTHAGPDGIKWDRVGADARASYKDLQVGVGYITGKNNDPSTPEPEKKNVWFAEAEYFVFPWMQPYVRYEKVTSNIHDAEHGDKGRFIVGTALLARANVKFNLEGKTFTKNEPGNASTGSKHREDQVVVRLDYAF